MKSTLILAAAVTMTVAGLGYGQQQTQQQQQQAGQAQQQVDPSQYAAGEDPAEIQKAAAELRNLIPKSGVNVTAQSQNKELRQAALRIANDLVQSNSDITKIGGYLTQADQQKLANMQASANTEYSQQVQQLRDNFKQKYGRDLNIPAGQQIYRYSKSIEAQVTDPAQVTNWPAAPLTTWATASGTDTSAQAASNTQGQQQAGANAQTASNTQSDAASGALKAGDKIAIMMVAMDQSKPLYLSFVNQGGWKLDVPGGINPAQTTQSLTQRMKYLNGKKDTWPQNAESAEQFIANQVLLSLYDTSVAKQRQQQQPAK